MQKQGYLVKQGCLGSGRYASEAMGFAEGMEELGEDRGTELVFIEKTGLCVILKKAQAFWEAEAQILNNLLKRPAMNDRHRI